MKLFSYDIVTGRRGEQIGWLHVPNFFKDAIDVKLPRPQPGTEWRAYEFAADRRGNRTFFKGPVCFCIGQLTCGTDTAWHWIVIVPPADQGFGKP